jgi:hypothetical protein
MQASSVNPAAPKLPEKDVASENGFDIFTTPFLQNRKR